jgi:hypothetical protein
MSDSRGFPSFQTKPVQLTKTEEPEPTKDSTMLLVLVTVAALLVAAGGAWFFLLSGDEEPVAAAAPTSVASATPTPSAEPTPGPTGSPKAKKAATSDSPRDPFKALVYDETADVETPEQGADTSDTSGAVTTGGTGSMPVPPAAAEPALEASVPSTDGTTESSGVGEQTGVQLTLSAVDDDNATATVDVGSERFVVATGDDFAEVFSTEELRTGTCATFSYGDRNLELCEGETIHLS